MYGIYRCNLSGSMHRLQCLCNGCPVDAITMTLNPQGYLEPVIDETK